jgi:PST family polysaccharide transporter
MSDNKRRLLNNFFSLSVLQGVNYILPLITLPYLVRVLGPERYGLIAFALALIQYLIVFTDYGFNLSATREISINRENRRKVSEIFSSVMFIKIMIMILCFIILLFIVVAFEKFRSDYLVYFFTFGMVLGYALFPIWFFQGIEKMKYIAYINILAKLLFTVSIFILIKKPSHYIYVPLLNSMGFIVAGILAAGIAIKNFRINLKEISKESIKYHFKDGWHIFISTISINFYKTNCIFILGLFTNNTVVGYFSIVKKLVDASNQLAVIVSQSIYPYISKRIKETFDRSVVFLKKVGISLFAFTFFVGLAFLIFADGIVYLIAGEAFRESVISLRLMSFVPLIIGVNVPAVQILLGHGLDKEFSRVVAI